MDFRKIIGKLKSKKNLITLLFVFFIAQLIIGASILYFGSINVTGSLIDSALNQAKNDVVLKGSEWDMAKYDSDPELPGPYRIYMITKDGYVIERWRSIPGFLDTSDFKQLLNYQTPKNLTTITNQKWQLFAEPIENSQNTKVGLVLVGHHIESEKNQEDNIRELKEIAAKIKNQIFVDGSDLNTGAVDIRDIPYDTSFQIVDQYNGIHLKSDNANSLSRVPNYIDPSYITPYLAKPNSKIINSGRGSEKFLVKSLPLIDKNGSPAGTIIVARTISPFIKLIKNYILIAGLIGLLLFISVVSLILFTNWFIEDQKAKPLLLTNKLISTIKFDKKTGILMINDHSIKFAYATNQYYLCTTLFSAPKKKWETDELIDKFGMHHDIGSWRKIYDSAVSVNKKAARYVNLKLIVVDNKTFQLNQSIVVKIT